MSILLYNTHGCPMINHQVLVLAASCCGCGILSDAGCNAYSSQALESGHSMPTTRSRGSRKSIGSEVRAAVGCARRRLAACYWPRGRGLGWALDVTRCLDGARDGIAWRTGRPAGSIYPWTTETAQSHRLEPADASCVAWRDFGHFGDGNSARAYGGCGLAGDARRHADFQGSARAR